MRVRELQGGVSAPRRVRPLPLAEPGAAGGSLRGRRTPGGTLKSGAAGSDFESARSRACGQIQHKRPAPGKARGAAGEGLPHKAPPKEQPLI